MGFASLYPSYETLLLQSPRLDGVDLQRDVAAVDSGLRERAAGEPQARLRGAGPHVAEFLRGVVETPDAADAVCDIGAEQLRQEMVGALVASGEHDQRGLAPAAVAQADAVAL